jgi:alginate O-acetyltransferase complex protein AlgI
VFHNISLLVDLTGKRKETPDLKSVFLYIIFFPQLVSGPITRAEMFMPQIQPKYFGDIPFVEAAKWILMGFFFKLYVANNLNEMTSYMEFPLYETLQTQDRWLLVFLYSYQIYADFFGYSAIAIGLALLFGYRLPINFNLPYISVSFSEFWTRWHMSLSSWLRTYLYVPLGGNRHGALRTYLNLLIVMGLGGLWHGAGLGYLLWGLLHGVLLVIERPFLARLATIDSAAFRAARLGFVFVCVTMLWIFFKLPNFDHAASYLSGMFTPSTNPNPPKLFYDLALLYSLPVLIQHLVSRPRFEQTLGSAEPYLYGLMAALMYLEAGPETSFIYFQF